MQAFSGLSGDSSEFGGPIPLGDYDILERGHKDGFRLEPKDDPYGDDVHNETGRDNFRLHGPGGSIGQYYCR